MFFGMNVKNRCEKCPKAEKVGCQTSQCGWIFFDPARILDRLDYDHPGNVVEFGCGYGLCTVEAARRSSGTIYALDIEPEFLAATMTTAGEAGVVNVQPMECDFVADGIMRVRDGLQLAAYRRPSGVAPRVVPRAKPGAQVGNHPLELRPSHTQRPVDGYSANSRTVPPMG